LSLTVRDLVALPELELVLIDGQEEQGREIRSVHTTDLQHPGRYVLPGELVLTNGLWHPAVDADAWVAELCDSGATALGFGVGTPHATVPADVAAACRRRSLPLIQVPETLSFVAIAGAVTASDAESERTVFRRHLDRSRAMMRALSDGRGIDFLLEILLEETGLTSTLVSPGGRVLATTRPDVDVDEIRAAFDARERSGCSVTVFGGSGPNRRSTPSLLVWATPGEIDDEARVVVQQVTDHVELEAGWRRSERQAVLGIAQELVEALRAGGLSEAAFEARTAAIGLDPRRPVAVLALAHDAERSGAALDAAGGPFAIVPTRDAVIALVQPLGDDPVTAAAAGMAHLGEDPTIGGGGSGSGPVDVGRALAQASLALQLARHRPPGARVVRHDDLGSHAVLLGMLDPEVLAGFREQVLGPVERWDAEHGTDLIRTVAAFIENGGRWRATANELHIHHNTLRYRLGRVQALTGRNLANPADRLDVQIALLVLAR
jgi:PucR family transcriptional regulator, purine catabolism regulatory protein